MMPAEVVNITLRTELVLVPRTTYCDHQGGGVTVPWEMKAEEGRRNKRAEGEENMQNMQKIIREMDDG